MAFPIMRMAMTKLLLLCACITIWALMVAQHNEHPDTLMEKIPDECVCIVKYSEVLGIACIVSHMTWGAINKFIEPVTR